MLRIITLGALGVYWIAIFVGTHLPQGGGGLERVPDKLLHFGAYAGLAFLLSATLTALRGRRGTAVLPWTIAAIYGCVDELSQIPVPGRQGEFADWMADVLGAGVGVVVFTLFSLAVARFFVGSPAISSETITESAA